MATYVEAQELSSFVTRMRRLSKSNFTYESNSKSPRLDKMIAHVNLFDKTTRCLEDELQQSREKTYKQMREGRPRPQIARRDSDVYSKEDVPDWVADLTVRPTQNCVVVTEVEHAEDIDSDESNSDGSLSP